VLRLPRPRELRAALSRNAGLKLISLLLAFLIWFSINVSERDAERTVKLEVSTRRVPPGLIVTNLRTKTVAVTLRGPRTILDGVDERKTRIALDFSGATPGTRPVELKGEMLRPELPRRLKVVRLEPARATFTIERIVRRPVPVRADVTGVPAFGYKAGTARVTPAEVQVSGPSSKVAELKEVTTEPIELRGLSQTITREVLLSWAGDFVSFAPDRVSVTLVVEEARVTLTVKGPQRLLQDFALKDGMPYVDAKGLGPGKHRVSVQVDLPPELEIVRRQPESHTLEVGTAGAGK
jgi:YbbR domain-containing protein